MKASTILFCGLFASGAIQVSQAQQSSDSRFSTPAFSGNGSTTNNNNNNSTRGTSQFGTTGTLSTRTNANFGTSLSRSFATNLGTSTATNLSGLVGQPGSPAISPADATNAVGPLG